jgi:hypothetical protein
MQQIDFGTTFQRTFEKLKDWWQVLLPAAMIWGVIQGLLIGIVLLLVVGGAVGAGIGTGSLGVGLITGALGFGVMLALAVGLSAIQSGSLVWAAGQLESGHVPTISEVLQIDGEIGDLFKTGLLLGAIGFVAGLVGLLIPFLGWIALIVFGVWFGIRWIFVPLVVTHEGLSGMDALRRSREIVDTSGQFWVILGVVLVMGLIGGFAGGIVSGILGVVFSHFPLGGLLVSIIRFAANAGAAALVAIAVHDMYHELTSDTPPHDPNALPPLPPQ